MVNQIQNEVLNTLAQSIYNGYPYLQVDTSGTMPSKDSVELTNGGTQIGSTSALYNKLRNVSSPYTQLNDNILTMEFVLSTGEPYNQPINLQSLGLMSQQTSGGGLGFATTLPVSFTKTNQLQAKIRAELKVISAEDL